MELREYQKAAVGGVRAEVRKGHKHILLVCPTGAGKTHILSDITARCLANGHKVLALMHRRGLVTQMVDRFRENDIDPAIIMAGHRPSLESMCQVATCQTYNRRMKLNEKPFNPFFIDASIVLIDEAHHALSQTYQKILSEYEDKIIIGVTATPCLSTGVGMGNYFDAIVQPVGVMELIEKKYLVPGIYYGPTKPDLEKVRTVRGDYENKGLAAVMNQPKLVGDVVDNWLKLAGGLRTMVFAVRVSHSKALRDEFLRRGVAAEHLDAHSDDDERDAALDRFRSGETQVLCNVALYTEGTDIPEIECIVVARPTKSMGMHRQILGRGARPYPKKKEFVILDHGGNTERLGFYEDDVVWSLSGKEQAYRVVEPRKKEKTLLSCEYCSTIFSGKRCPRCGKEIEDWGKKIEAMEADLVKLNGKEGPSYQDKRNFYAMLEWWRDEKGYKGGWTYHKYRERFGENPKKFRVPKMEPDTGFRNYMTHLNIRWAKSRRGHA
jgi:DNA repair protein RadD